MSDIIVPIGGFGRFGWGEMPWGQTDLPKAITAIGSVTVVAEANAPVTGLEATGAIGTILVVAKANVYPNGVIAAGEIDSVTVVAKAIVAPTGVSATGGVNGVTVEADAIIVIPSGLQCQAFVYGGYIQVKADANAPVAGLQGTGSIGSVSIEVRARAEVTGVSGNRTSWRCYPCC
jgi:hypothetical protein